MNGQPITVAGANRHEHDDVGGKVVPLESMVRDALMMKRYNFNAVRTSHYPNHPFFYEVRNASQGARYRGNACQPCVTDPVHFAWDGVRWFVFEIGSDVLGVVRVGSRCCCCKRGNHERRCFLFRANRLDSETLSPAFRPRPRPPITASFT